jgi:competence protein ComGC
MNSVKNEHGYALVTVLLIVTVFMVLILSFMGQAFSSVKQNQMVEKKSRSVAAAEMGISYYQVAIQKTFESNQQYVSDYIKENSSLITNFKREAAKKTAELLQNATIEGPPNAPFLIKNFAAIADANPYSNKVNISFYMVGTDNSKDTTLFAKMTIDLESITNQATTEDSNNYVLPTYETILKPTVECKTLDCDDVYINGNGSFSGNNNIKDNQTIFTTGSLNLDGNGNENNKTNVQIHSDGAITVHQNMNSAANVVIETKDEANFMQNLKISGTSKLLIKKNLHVYQNLELANNSFAYVGENSATLGVIDAKIDNNLDILSSSKMCVYGDLAAKKITVDTDSNPPSKLLVLGTVTENGSEKLIYKVDIDTFKIECGVYIPPEFQIKWGDNVNTVINNVDYQ